VLHSTETSAAPGSAEAVAAAFASGPGLVSAHYVVGVDETIECVAPDSIAWAARGANFDAISVELTGRACKTNWLKDGWPVVARAARLVAELCSEWGLPVRRCSVKDLRAMQPGITTHAAVSEAWHLSDHVDPGGLGDRRWPWPAFLDAVKDAAGSLSVQRLLLSGGLTIALVAATTALGKVA
jgi:hypothetical protein